MSWGPDWKPCSAGVQVWACAGRARRRVANTGRRMGTLYSNFLRKQERGEAEMVNRVHFRPGLEPSMTQLRLPVVPPFRPALQARSGLKARLARLSRARPPAP